jgi:DNA-directed RNA polymerase subunit E'/Rpb7
MTDFKTETKIQNEGNQKKMTYPPYITSVLTQKVYLSINEIGKNVKQCLEQKLIQQNEGKCISQGFIKPNSINVLNYSSGLIQSPYTEFHVVFECSVCYPVENMLIECTVKTITKAGIHAEVIDNDIVSIVVFIAKDHYNTNNYFNSIKENAKITVKVIGVRFELNDPYISVIAELTY